MLEELLYQMESEALRISAGVGSWDKYEQLKRQADIELAKLIEEYSAEKN